MKSGQTKTTSAQHKRFVETARQLECDEDQERFEDKLRRVASIKPSPKGKKQSERMK